MFDPRPIRFERALVDSQAEDIEVAWRVEIEFVVAAERDKRIGVGDYGVVILSDDNGKTWRQASSVATRTTLTAVTFVDARLGWAVGHGGTVLHTANGDETWTQIYSAGPDVTLLSVWLENATRGIAAGVFGFAIATSDGGRTWKKFAVGEGDDRDRHLNGIFALPGGPLFIAACHRRPERRHHLCSSGEMKFRYATFARHDPPSAFCPQRNPRAIDAEAPY